MMNQHNGPMGRAGGRSGCSCGSMSDPRRTRLGRDMYPYGRLPSGCGCTAPRPEPRRELETEHSGCGCASKPNCGKRTGCGCGQSPRRPSPCGQSPAYDEKPACGCSGDVACDKLLEQIRAVDFALYEVILYLDAYPNSCDALETYHKLKAQREELHATYEAACGPLTAFGNESKASWDWMKKPFPWDYDAN